MKEAIEAALSAIEQGKPAALATPVTTEGSIPTPRTARMLVHADGSIVGTVGGGSMEEEMRLKAKLVIEDRRPQFVHFSLTAESAADEGLLCGGSAKFVLEPILPDTPAEPFRKMLDLQPSESARQRARLSRWKQLGSEAGDRVKGRTGRQSRV